MKRTIQTPPEVQQLLNQKVPLILGTSGGKDSMAVALAVARELESYAGPKLLLHADLGMTEWTDSWPSCQRLSEKVGIPLESCTRPAGGMMERWEARWASSIRRYLALETLTVVLPWSTPAMRFCQSELKVDPMATHIKRKFGKVAVLNVTGIRGQESSARAKQPICAPMLKLPNGSLSWRPIHHWTTEDVWAEIEEAGLEAHEAYSLFGSSRVSCVLCIMSNENDLYAGLKDERNHPLYRRMCELELTSGFAFQGNRWISALAPTLLDRGRERLAAALELANARKAVEAKLPKHLQLKSGKAQSVPTSEEAKIVADTRKLICGIYGWEPNLTDADEIILHYKTSIKLGSAQKGDQQKQFLLAI